MSWTNDEGVGEVNTLSINILRAEDSRLTGEDDCRENGVWRVLILDRHIYFIYAQTASPNSRQTYALQRVATVPYIQEREVRALKCFARKKS